MTATALASDVIAEHRFEVLGPPVPKARARMCTTKSGKRFWYTPEATRRYESLVRAIGESTTPTWWPVAERYSIDVAIYFPDRRARDADNVLKSVLDALEGVCFENDRLVYEKHVTKDLDRRRPRIEVTVRAHAPEQGGLFGAAPLERKEPRRKRRKPRSADTDEAFRDERGTPQPSQKEPA